MKVTGQDLAKVLDRVIAHYQPIVELGTGAVAGFEILARIPDDAGPARSIGPMIEEIESDPTHLERLMRRLLMSIQRDVQPLFARFPDFYVSVNVPPVMIGDGNDPRELEELGLTALRRPVGLRGDRAAGAGRRRPRRAGQRSQVPLAHRDGRLRHREQRPGAAPRDDDRRAQARSLAGRAPAERPDGRPPGARHRRARERAAGAHRGRRRGDRRAGVLPARRRRRLRPGLVLEQGRCRPKSCRG